MAKRLSGRMAQERGVARNKEEEAVLAMYRGLGRWEKNALQLLMNGLRFGRLSPEKTDNLPWEKIRNLLPFQAPKREATNG